MGCCSCGCSVLCSKAFLILFNSIFLLTGGGILGLGLWLHFDKDVVTYIHILHSSEDGTTIAVAAYILIGVGGFVLLVGFLGCCGACCESICMLCLYSFLVLIVLIAEIAAAALIFIFNNRIDDYVQTSLQTQLKTKYNKTSANKTDVFTIAWDYMQVHLNCCGSSGPGDYSNSTWFKNTKGDGVFVPATCCILTNDDAKYPQVDDVVTCQLEAATYATATNIQAMHTKGCYHALKDWVKENMTLLITLASVTIGLQLIGLILSCCLMQAIRRMEKDSEWTYNSVENLPSKVI